MFCLLFLKWPANSACISSPGPEASGWVVGEELLGRVLHSDCSHQANAEQGLVREPKKNGKSSALDQG